MNNEYLKITKLNYEIDKKTIISDLNLAVKEGEFIGRRQNQIHRHGAERLPGGPLLRLTWDGEGLGSSTDHHGEGRRHGHLAGFNAAGHHGDEGRYLECGDHVVHHAAPELARFPLGLFQVGDLGVCSPGR